MGGFPMMGARLSQARFFSAQGETVGGYSIVTVQAPPTGKLQGVGIALVHLAPGEELRLVTGNSDHLTVGSVEANGGVCPLVMVEGVVTTHVVNPPILRISAFNTIGASIPREPLILVQEAPSGQALLIETGQLAAAELALALFVGAHVNPAEFMVGNLDGVSLIPGTLGLSDNHHCFLITQPLKAVYLPQMKALMPERMEVSSPV